MCDVLLLDDNPAIRNTLAETLEHHGLVVVEASSIQEARSALLKHSGCRVLVADNDLGECDGTTGFAFAEEVKKTKPNVSIIYISGCSDLLANDQARQQDEVLHKPFPPSRLLSAVRTILTSSSES